MCQRFDTLHAKGNEIVCDCGVKAIYDEYGYLRGDQIKEWDNTIKWNSFQKNWLIGHKNDLKKQIDEAFSHDEDLHLYKIIDNERTLIKDDVKAQLYGDRIVLTSGDDFALTFYWKEINKLGMFRNNSLYLTYHDERYELHKLSGFSLLKYFSLWRVLTDKELY